MKDLFIAICVGSILGTLGALLYLSEPDEPIGIEAPGSNASTVLYTDKFEIKKVCDGDHLLYFSSNGELKVVAYGCRE